MDIISISTHDEDEKSEGHSQNEKIRICLVGDSATCEKTKKAAYELNVPIIFSETGSEYLFDTEWKTYFVLTDFSGDIFNILSKSRQR
uniref:Uncharacterized protein n=1 Tax=Megaselia scalaris TaxID=36166 RepID=T1GK93_MEGSC